ncbi:MAG: hypothetical protein NC548_13700 [Lachnospiraceae bacterium]|nr:hypothetical protein [Lachnospiraceae bacterium]
MLMPEAHNADLSACKEIINLTLKNAKEAFFPEPNDSVGLVCAVAGGMIGSVRRICARKWNGNKYKGWKYR